MRALTTADDTFHQVGSDSPWWTETVWFAWMVPERRLLGHFYLVFRPNLGLFAGGVTVFDATTDVPVEQPFHAWDWHQPLPAGLDLRDAHLANGMAIVAERPGEAYRLAYDHRGGLSLRLRWESTTEPLVTHAVSPFNAGHIDHLGHVTGTMTLNGSTVEVDCLAMRDRSWGPRPEGRQPRAGYCYAAVPGGPSFLAVDVTTRQREGITTGFLNRDGVRSTVTSGIREVERDAEGRPAVVRVGGKDELGRAFTAEGRIVSRQGLKPYSSMFCWNSLVRWNFEGRSCWGEDQDVWHPRKWRAALLELKAAAR